MRFLGLVKQVVLKAGSAIIGQVQNSFKTPATYSHVFNDAGAMTGGAPDTDTPMDLSDCRSCEYHWRTDHTDHTHSVNTISVISSPDGTNYDTYQTPWMQDSIADVRAGSFIIPCGPKYVKVRMTTSGGTVTEIYGYAFCRK